MYVRNYSINMSQCWFIHPGTSDYRAADILVPFWSKTWNKPQVCTFSRFKLLVPWADADSSRKGPKLLWFGNPQWMLMSSSVNGIPWQLMCALLRPEPLGAWIHSISPKSDVPPTPRAFFLVHGWVNGWLTVVTDEAGKWKTGRLNAIMKITLAAIKWLTLL